MTGRRGERGSALVAVLCLIFTAGIITTAVLALSKIGSFTVAAHVELQRSMYVAEGAGNRVQWLLAADRSLNSDRTLGSTEYSDETVERFLADGVVHQLDYYGQPVEFVITDTVSGVDVSGTNFTSSLNELASNMDDEDEWLEKVSLAVTLLTDYVDSDDDITPDGREAGDYEEMGMAPLPRNEELQYREEIFYMPEILSVLPPDSDGRLSRVRLVPPDGVTNLTGTASLFSADKELLRTVCGLDDEETKLVLAALDEWKTNRTQISESLDPELYAKLSPLSKSESGNYTVLIRSPKTEKRPFRKLVFSYVGYDTGGPEDGTLKYLEWMYL